MARFVKGEVVVIPFPFSDLSDQKRRPALVVIPLDGDDIILCQITSQHRQDQYAIPLTASDFAEGNLKTDSYIRPNRLFTADTRIVAYTVGKLKAEKYAEVQNRLIAMLQEG